MSEKRIFVLNGHPAETSLSKTFADTYVKSAQAAGHEVRVQNLSDLDFDPDYGFGGYSYNKPLEPALEEVLQNIEWSNHVVVASPMWWGGLPAKLKGLIDRAFLPGRTFDTKSGGLPKPMLKGRTARVILTSDTPGWYFRIVHHRALHWQLKRQILGFIGLKPVEITHFSGGSHPKEGVVDRWVSKVAALGQQAA